MSSCNCFICGEEITSDKMLINKIAICLKCIKQSNIEDDFKSVKDIIASFKKISILRKKKK